MIDQAILVATFAAAIGCGLVAGIFYAFSSFVMGALGRVPPAHGIEAMQAINVVVINRSFMLAFFGTAILCLALLVASYVRWNDGGGKLLLLGSLLYLVGTIGVTMVFNVPLNNALAAVDAGSANGAALWTKYLSDWTMWNHVRTAALCVALLVAAWLWWNAPAGKLLLLGSAIYLAGTIGVTMAFNVPLNNALAAAQPATPEAATLWAHYLERWTMWNTVRTVAPTVSMALFIAALIWS